MDDETNNWTVTSTGMLQEFAECAEAVAATPKKLEKAAILGGYLDTLRILT